MTNRLRKSIWRLAVWTILMGGFLWPAGGYALRAGQAAPEIAAGSWVNSQPLTIAELRGRVVLVEFWTYG